MHTKPFPLWQVGVVLARFQPSQEFPCVGKPPWAAGKLFKPTLGFRVYLPFDYKPFPQVSGSNADSTLFLESLLIRR